MRISDWSSDVCSSDLFHADNDYYFFDAADAPTSALIQDFEETRPEPSYEVGLNFDRDYGPWTLALIGLVHRLQYESEKIGRASCRERVCQYVWISVVAVSLKKKTIQKQIKIEQ